MMQFSAAPWRVLDEEHLKYCVDTANLHASMGHVIEKLADHAAKTGEAIMRHMAYEFPENGYESINDQFMLGSEILVAPVILKGATERAVVFPEGKWIGDDGSVVKGPCSEVVNAPLSRLPWYRREK
jgi:alpha-glucosidase (family GH31 glycosyl hydrolase)